MIVPDYFDFLSKTITVVLSEWQPIHCRYHDK